MKASKKMKLGWSNAPRSERYETVFIRRNERTRLAHVRWGKKDIGGVDDQLEKSHY